jgi:hypothetical protein
VHTNRIQDVQGGGSDLGYLVGAEYINTQIGSNGFNIWHLSDSLFKIQAEMCSNGK